MKNTLLILVVALFLAACHTPEPGTPQLIQKVDETITKTNNNSLIASIEAAHKNTNFQTKKDVSFDIELTFGGTKRLDGNITLSTDSRKGKITNENGTIIVFSDGEVSTSSAEMNPKSARFSAYTWPYFFMFPYKLSDPGTIWNSFDNSALNGTEFITQKLTFTSGTGDAPDDWYIMYADKETKLTHCAAYIVTAGGSSQKEAEEDPHAIQYLDYKTVDGIPISHEWKFWGWRTDEGLTDQLGFAKISNVKFLDVEEGFYSID